MNLIKKIAAFMRSRSACAPVRTRRRRLIKAHSAMGFAARCRRGVAALEFALTLPIWVVFLAGMTDGAYCMLINEKTDRIAYTVTNIVTQYQNITIANLNDIVQAAGQLMQPFSFGNNGLVIVTSIYKPTGQSPVIEWQYVGGGTLTKVSQIGTTGGTPILPNGLTLNDNDNVIISEVYYNFTPMFPGADPFTSGTVYRVGIYKPRLSPLIKTPT
jgi:hypothetical protein